MNRHPLLLELDRMDNAERVTLIERASHLVRRDLMTMTCPTDTSADPDARLREAADAARALYEPGGQHTDWTALDSEEVLDDTLPR